MVTFAPHNSCVSAAFACSSGSTPALRRSARPGRRAFLSLSILRLFGDSCDFAEAPASPLFSGPCAPPFAHPSTGHLIAWPPLHFHFLIHSSPPPGLSRSFRPTRSLALSWFLSTPRSPGVFPSSLPQPSRSFRPTRFLAASLLSFTFTASTFPLLP